MKDAIRTALKNIDTIRTIYKKFITPTLNPEQQEEYIDNLETWTPVMVVCENCGRLIHPGKTLHSGGNIPNRITAFDLTADTVTYTCASCNHQATAAITKARLKLTWRVDWPAKWAIHKVTCEPAGKDHATKGGAYDTGLEICKRVFEYPGPVKIPYEWLRFGAQDMKTHKGIIFTPQEYLKIGMPETLRYQILNTPASKAINIKPELFPQLIDETLEIEDLYFGDENPNDPKWLLARQLYPLIIIGEIPPHKPLRLPFRFSMIFAQLDSIMTSDQIIQKSRTVFKQINDIQEILPEHDRIIEQELDRAKYWVKYYAPEKRRITIPQTPPLELRTEITPPIKEALDRLISKLTQDEEITEVGLQNFIFQTGSNIKGSSIKQFFSLIYRILLNKSFGPRLGAFILSLDRDWVIQRIQNVIS